MLIAEGNNNLSGINRNSSQIPSGLAAHLDSTGTVVPLGYDGAAGAGEFRLGCGISDGNGAYIISAGAQVQVRLPPNSGPIFTGQPLSPQNVQDSDPLAGYWEPTAQPLAQNPPPVIANAAYPDDPTNDTLVSGVLVLPLFLVFTP